MGQSAEQTATPDAVTPVDLHTLFVAHGAYVASSLRRLGVPFDDIEDVLHEVFLQVHKRLADYDSARPARPWLFAFAFRVASDHRRRIHGRREVGGAAFEPADPSPQADERLAMAQDRQLVIEALQGIPLDRRAVFVLYEIDGMTSRDIAETLSIPVNTVYSRLRLSRGEFADAVKRIRARRGGR